MLTAARFRELEQLLRARGLAPLIAWSEQLAPPVDADAFALEVVHVIVNAGMKATVAAPIVARCMAALNAGTPVRSVYGHPGKAAAIETVWAARAWLFATYRAVDDKVAFCGALPWCGPVTKFHLAKNLGEDAIKPDVHLVRLARWHNVTPFALCERLARETGRRVGTVDTVLWRCCADGIIDSVAYAAGGWALGFRGNGFES